MDAKVGTLKRSSRTASQRWQIRGREMARFIDELAPLNDATALGFLRGAVEEGWVTEAQVSIPARAAACGRRRR